jgi:hypothetical protein
MNHLLRSPIQYSMNHVIGAGLRGRGFGNSNYGQHSIARARAMSDRVANAQPVPAGTEMMCSEAVAFAYQGTPDPYVILDAKHVSPIQLEEYFRLSIQWTLIGRIGN